jgi:multidrug efflux pump subunit AcrA (membrane-fusion protein)
VWRYDPASGTVRRTRIGVGNVAGNEVVVTDGLAAGDVIVVAGAHQLQEGQKVRPLAEGGAPRAPDSVTVEPGRAQKG